MFGIVSICGCLNPTDVEPKDMEGKVNYQLEGDNKEADEILVTRKEVNEGQFQQLY